MQTKVLGSNTWSKLDYLSERNEMAEKNEVKRVDKEWVQTRVQEWESRHDEWAKKGYYVKCKDFSGLRKFLKDKLFSDWRYALAFFIDRTTYQGFGDANAEKVSACLIKEILTLPSEFSNKNLSEMIKVMEKKKDKALKQVKGEECRWTTVRKAKDIERVQGICDFFIQFPEEKNFTKIVESKGYETKFLKSFRHVGDKTANFYLKFLLLVLDVTEILPITIDTHVKQSLKRFGWISEQENRTEVLKKTILDKAEEIGVAPIKLETALYEENFRRTHNI